MRTATFFNCDRVLKTVCAQCGKVFYRSHEWIYRKHKGSNADMYCGYNCMVRAQKGIRPSGEVIDIEHRPRILTEAEKTRICDLRKQGLSLKQISDVVYRSRNGVLKALHERGLN